MLVDIVSRNGKPQWTQEAGGLKVTLPAQKPCDHAIVFRCETA
jgi:hypothetical protein